jgi:ankyrin repeat protein
VLSCESKNGGTLDRYSGGCGRYTDVVSSMLEKGFDVNVEDIQGYTALTCAAGQGHTEIVKLLVRAASLSNSNKSFGRALAVAVVCA